MMNTQTTRQPHSILVALALCMALQMTGFVMLLPLFARRFESFGAGVEALGMSALAYALTSAIAAPFMGMLADRLGRRPIILLSLAAYALAFSGYLFAASAWLLILLRGLAGLGNGLFDPALSAHILDITPPEHTARIMGLRGTVGSLGNMLGPALVVGFTSWVSPQGVFLMAAALVGMLAFATALVLRAPRVSEVVHVGS